MTRIWCGFLLLVTIFAAACGDNIVIGDNAPVVGDLQVTAYEDTPVTQRLSATDPEGVDLTIELGQPAHGVVTRAGLDVTYTPAHDYSGPDQVTVTVSDGVNSVKALIMITVVPRNDAPVGGADSLATAANAVLVVAQSTLLANDTDVESDPLIVLGVTSGANGTAVLAGTDVQFTPSTNFIGVANFQYTISDGKSTALVPVTVTVGGTNAAPIAVDDTATTAEDTAIDLTSATLTANDTDPDGQTLAVTAVGNPTNGTVVLTGSTATFTPAADFVGAATFAYTITDGALTDTGLVTITVTAVNDAPIAVDDTATTTEDTAVDVTEATLLANDTDVDGPTLAVTGVSNPVNGTVNLAGTTATFTPATDFAGTATFDYTVSDGTLTDTGTVSITVTPVDDAPVAVDDTATTNEDTAIDLTSATLTANDTDSDGPSLTVTAVNTAVNGTVALSGGTATFTPDANFVGTASFEYTVSDGTSTDVGLVTITVVAVDDAPVAVDDVATTTEDTDLVVSSATLTANDTDSDGPALAVTAVGAPVNGTVVLTGTTITFTPTADFTGTAGFDYTVSDGTLSSTGHVTITVTAVNDAPVAVDDTATTPEDQPLSLSSATLVANDTDVDGPALAVTAVANPTNGTVSLAGSTIVFKPAANFFGVASFEYTVSDGTLSDGGTVTVTVTPVNDAPVAVDDFATTTEDTAVDITVATLLANDTDVDSLNLTVTGVGNPTHGTVALSAGTATFTPAANFTGTATFEYTVSDGSLSDTGVVSITVTPINDGPVAGNDARTAQTNVTSNIPAAALLANDTDVDGPALSIASVGNPVNGSVTLTGTTVSFTSDPAFIGTASFEYTVTDGSLTDIALVTVTVQAAAVCGDGAVTGLETCDDGLKVPGDGCSAICREETGWSCAGAPSTCTPICGDSTVVGTEQCDDGDGIETDGCTTQCVLGAVCDTVAFPGGDSFAVDPVTGHCYVSFDTDATTFPQAQLQCTGIGGHLATITSGAEDAVASSVQNVAENPWIGGREDANDTDAIFAWVTGEPFVYAHFAQGQPDDDAALDGNGDCLHLVDASHQWNDTNCNLTTFVKGRICEIEPDAIVTFSFLGSAGNEVKLPADGPTPGLAAVPLMSRGPGVGPAAAAGAFSGNGWTTTPGLDVNDYYSFTLAPTPGGLMTLRRLELDDSRSGSGPTGWSVRSSVDNFATDLQTFTILPGDTTMHKNQTILLDAAFSNRSVPVEFRIYGYAALMTAGTWRIDNVEVFGTTGP